jgi:hypothetical protein
MTQALIALALSMGLAASPPSNTQIAANNAADSAAPRTSARAPMSQARPAAPEKTYCTSGTITGSRVTKQECKTKAQWAKEGVDIEDLLNSQE